MMQKSQPGKKVSTLDKWADDYNVQCSCDRENTAVYYCNVEGCKDAS
jgi:hypothetical protein